MGPARRRRVAAWAVVLVLFGAGCTGAVNGTPTSDAGSDGTTGSDAAPYDASPPPGDASPPDAGVDASVVDGGGADATGDGPLVDGDTCDAPGQCGPGVVTTAPIFVPPEPTQEGVCTQQQINDYFNSCFSSSATSYSCNAWYNDPDAGPANQTCSACVITDSASSAWGPFVYFDQEQNTDFNYGGCIAVLDPSQAACAQSVELDEQCDYAACSQCLVVDPTTANDLYQCMNVADSVPCACESYAQAATCVNAETDGGPAAACLSFDLPTYYYATVPVFCGVASDAGVADAGGD